MLNAQEEKTVTNPVIDGGVFTPIDPLTGAVGTEDGDLEPETLPENISEDGKANPHKNTGENPQENTPGHHKADRALEYDDAEDVQSEHR